VLQPLLWRCVECVIHHDRDVHEEKQYIYVARTSNNRVIAVCDQLQHKFCKVLSQHPQLTI